MNEKVMDMWVIYDSPTDFPGLFVARRHEILCGTHQPTKEYYTAKLLKILRIWVQGEAPGCVLIPRSPEDDPKIVESWL
jgi:hypothetical protein